MATGETTSTRSVGSDVSASADDDKRLAFVYQEAIRGLQLQQYVVESLNNRGGNLIFATAFATSLLGTRALSDGVGFLDWIAVCLLFLVGALIVFIQRIRVALQLSLIVLLLEILAWLVSIGASS